MAFYERGPVRIHYEEEGKGFPLLLIAGGGLNSTIAGLKQANPFNPIAEFKERVPLHRHGPAQRGERQSIRTARRRSPVGFLHRRPASD